MAQAPDEHKNMTVAEALGRSEKDSENGKDGSISTQPMRCLEHDDITLKHVYICQSSK